MTSPDADTDYDPGRFRYESEYRYLIFASGGHASVVREAIRAMGEADPESNGKPSIVVGFHDPFQDQPLVDGLPVFGFATSGSEGARECRRIGATHFAIGIGSIRGGAGKREQVFFQAKRCGLEGSVIRHPSAVIAAGVAIGEASVIMAGAVIQPRVRLGRNVIVNTKASIDHDCVIGDHSHIAPGVTISGGVVIGEDTLIGTGVVIRQGVKIGDGATIGTGAVVVEDIPSRTLAYGNPARLHG